MKRKLYLLLFLVIAICGLLVCCSPKQDNGESNDNVTTSDKLATPEISLQDDVVSWQEISNADYYVVFVNDKWVAVEHSTSYKLNYTTNGTYTVKIYAADSYRRYKSSGFSNQVDFLVQRKTLQCPTITLNAETLSWHDVEGATNYEVYVNGSRSSLFGIVKHAAVNTLQVGFSKSGVYDIAIKALSNNSLYEGESESNHVIYRFSNNKKWSARQISDNWKVFGNAQYRSDKLFMQYDASYDSGIANRLYVDVNHSVLYLFCDKSANMSSDFSANNFCVKVDGKVLTNILTPHENIPDKCFVYDLSDFVNKLVDVEITVENDASMYINQVKLFTTDNVSRSRVWTSSTICDEWVSDGITALHPEGFCLETRNNVAAGITNDIRINNESMLKITFFKFDRVGAQDIDPKVFVYVNGESLKPIGCSTEYATVQNQAGGTFSYDITKYRNSDVKIVIQSTEGEHACFSSIQIGN